MVVGAAIAARTKRLRIGTAVILLPLHNPLQLAEEIATLDNIADGRVDVGVSRGGVQKYYDGFSIKREERFDRFNECLAIMAGLWSNERFAFDGQYYQLPEVALRPRPLQQPHPFMYIATYDLPSVVEFAQRGFGVLEGGVQTPENVKAKIAAYNEAWQAAWPGTPAPLIPTNRMIYCGEDDESAWREIEPWLAKAFKGQKTNTVVQGAGDLFSFLEKGSFEEFAHQIAIVGGPETVAQKLMQLHDEAGVRYVMSLVHFFWEMPAELMRASMARLAEHVMPRFDTAG
jgi:alkanesulfonate monooxygenase SsuD/methylene tetrahydromethanopterin reductase-like flavin-dependent oxidoreductase (luciferase family)